MDDNNINSIVLSNDITSDTTLIELLDLLPESTKSAMAAKGNNINLYIKSFVQGLSGTILICNPAKCPYAELCPFNKISEAPAGHFCPLETTFVHIRRAKYITDYTPDDTFAVVKIHDLVSLELIENRIKAMLASEGLMIEEVRGVAPKTGEAVMGRGQHPLLVQLFSISKRKDNLLKTLGINKKEADTDWKKKMTEAIIQMDEDTSKENHKEDNK